MVVRGAKHPSHLCDVFGIVVVDDGVSEVQLEAAAKVRIGGTPGQLLERVVLQRVQPAESDETVRKLCDLLAGPVVVASELSPQRRLRCEKAARRCRPSTGRLPADARGVQLRNQVGGSSGFRGATGGVADTSSASSGLNRCWW